MALRKEPQPEISPTMPMAPQSEVHAVISPTMPMAPVEERHLEISPTMPMVVNMAGEEPVEIHQTELASQPVDVESEQKAAVADVENARESMETNDFREPMESTENQKTMTDPVQDLLHHGVEKTV